MFLLERDAVLIPVPPSTGGDAVRGDLAPVTPVQGCGPVAHWAAVCGESGVHGPDGGDERLGLSRGHRGVGQDLDDLRLSQFLVGMTAQRHGHKWCLTGGSHAVEIQQGCGVADREHLVRVGRSELGELGELGHAGFRSRSGTVV